ncbi:Uncharacterised protein [Mycobacteroides abscessus subsp. abscessus]|nr:Uncharacterised protein [Mycobacteroides abscessus subsp. abscessus]
MATTLPTQRQAVALLSARSSAFAQAWTDRNRIEGRPSYDARDAVGCVREGMAARKALLLIGFPIDSPA